MSPEQIQTALVELARTKVRLDGALNAGELANQLDSVQRLTLVVAIEDHFEVCFDPEDETQIRDMADLVRLIESKLREA
jgi:acyl carrier protein